MSKKITLLILVLCVTTLSAQNVTTITDGSFSDALALDSQGNLYCSDWSGNTVYKYNTSGVVSIFKDGFMNPNGIGINPSDEIYICDHTANKILKYDTNGNLLQEFRNGLNTPAGIKNIPNTSDMLVVEYGNAVASSSIKRLAADGSITTLMTGSPLNGPAGIAYINDVPYIANFNDRKIFRFENNALTEIAQLPAEGPPSRNFLGFMSALDDQLIATHIGGHKLYKIDPTSGDVSVYMGSSGGNTDGNISAATLDSPNGIIGDQTNGRIFVSQGSLQPNNRNLRIIEGAVLSFQSLNKPSMNVLLYTNPNKDSLFVRLSGFSGAEIQLSVFDVNGREIFKKKYTDLQDNVEKKIATSHWRKGVYMLEVQSVQGKLTEKVILK